MEFHSPHPALVALLRESCGPVTNLRAEQPTDIWNLPCESGSVSVLARGTRRERMAACQ